VASFAIQPDGSLAPASQVVQHSNGDVQPHAHSVTMSPNNTELIAVDLGLDQVRRYALSAATGAISLRQTLQMKQGLGACLFTFGKTGKHAYVGNECVHVHVALLF
jgi:6-phosphogluconolactonase